MGMEVVSWNEILKVCNRLGFPEDAVTDLGRIYDVMIPRYADKLQKLAGEWMSIEGDWQKCIREIAALSQEGGVSANGLRMVFFLYCAIPLWQEYQKRGLPESLYWEVLQDLRYKLMECRALYGEWGTFVPDWYPPSGG